MRLLYGFFVLMFFGLIIMAYAIVAAVLLALAIGWLSVYAWKRWPQHRDWLYALWGSAAAVTVILVIRHFTGSIS